MVISALKELAPTFLKTTLVFGGRSGPVHGYVLPSSLASHTSFWLGIRNDSPSPPEAVNSIVSGELCFMFLVFHFPAMPDAPETRWKVTEFSKGVPAGEVPLDTKLRLLPSAATL